MPKIVELVQNRNLICKNFDGYKLSLDCVPMQELNLSSEPLNLQPSEGQYSLLHVELFSMKNHLVSDPWARELSYFIDTSVRILRSSYNESQGRPDECKAVFAFNETDIEPRIDGDYNYSMHFVSEKLCVLCDGIQTLYLFDTGDRLKAIEWKIITKQRIVIGTEENVRNFTIYDSRLDVVQEKQQISLILGRVKSQNGHFNELYWSQLCHENDAWTFNVMDIIDGKGSLFYCALEPGAKAVVICSNRQYEFRTQNFANAPLENLEEKPQLHDGLAEWGFNWTQTADDIIITFPIIKGKHKSDYSINCSTEKLSVKCADEVLLDHELYSKVDLDMYTWTVQDKMLKITLVKQMADISWPSLFPNGAGPQETNDSETIDENQFDTSQKPIVNLEAPIEDCDFPMNATDDEVTIERFHLSSKERTHRIVLGSVPPLFSTVLLPDYPPALVTRQDVDASLWLQNVNLANEEEWYLRHEGNLNAIGYIQASKIQKKFMGCAPDTNYTVICESHHHVFLYKSKHDTAEGLRNRNGPQVNIGKQFLIHLDDANEILGLSTHNNIITLLTKKSLIYLQVP